MSGLLLVVLATAAAQPAPSPQDQVSIDFVVSVPPASQPAERIFVSGNHAAVGPWRPDGAALSRGGDGRYRGSIRLPRDFELEYKLTRGTWETVEKGPLGQEIDNRRLSARQDMTVELSVARWAESSAARAATRTGNIQVHEKFHSRALNNERTILVYLPPDYDQQPRRRYPVLYLHDGQNVFDAATSFLGIEWQADETAERLIRADRIRPIIMVGIYNTADRANEYTPWADAGRKVGGKGDLYADFLVNELKPFIDSRYRTRPDRAHTAVAGSSLGGLISLHLGMKHAATFSMCGVMSPALWWGEKKIVRDFLEQGPPREGFRCWLDMGSREGAIREFNTGIQQTRELVAAFDRHGMAPGRDYYYFEDVDAVHNESAWQARFDKMLLFFFAR